MTEKKEEEKGTFQSEDKRIQLVFENPTSLGNMHDFLVRVKGMIVDQIMKAQSQDEESNEAINKKTEPEIENKEKPEEEKA